MPFSHGQLYLKEITRRGARIIPAHPPLREEPRRPVTCPKCKFEQADGQECLRCGIIFSKFKSQAQADTGSEEESLKLQTSDSPEPPPAENQLEDTWMEDYHEPEEDRPSSGIVQRVFRVLPWLSLGATLVGVYLIFQQAPPIQVKMDPRALQRVEHKMEQLQIAAMTGQPYLLSLDEAELNAWLRASMDIANRNPMGQVKGYAPELNVPVDDPRYQEAQSAMKDLRVNLSGDMLKAYAVFDFRGRNLSLLLEGRIKVDNGYLRLEPTSGKIGSLPIPKMTLDAVVTRLFDSPQNRENFQVSPAISTVDIRHGQLFVAYR